jgi:phosphate-selective porin OprO and OprP
MGRLLLSGLCLIVAVGFAAAQKPGAPIYGTPPAGFEDFGSITAPKLGAPEFVLGEADASEPGPIEQQNPPVAQPASLISRGVFSPGSTEKQNPRGGQVIFCNSLGGFNPGFDGQQNLPQPDGDSALEQRLNTLEMQINQLQNQPGSAAEAKESDSSALPGTAAGQSETSRFPSLDLQDGFFIRSPDGKNFLRITGQIQSDYHGYLNSVDTTDLDTFVVRRARLGLEATVFQYYEFRLLPDYGNGQVVIEDAYANVHYIDDLQMEVGKFKQPISYEQVDILDRFVPFLERSIIDQLTPARDPGIMLHGENLFTNRFDYGASLSNGGINGNLDTNNSSDFDARIVCRPFNSPDCWFCVCGWQIGLSGGFGNEHEPINPSILHTPAGVPWFEFNSTVTAAGVRTRLCPETAYFCGPLGLAAQYMDQHQEMRPAAALAAPKYQIDVPINGFYVMGTLLLTGEERTSYTELSPLAPFDIRSPWNAPGAWELAMRVSRLDVGDQVFEPGAAQLASPKLWSRGATELTSGFNWYCNKWVRVQFNWEHASFDQPVQLGTGTSGKTQHQDSLLTRFQIIF